MSSRSPAAAAAAATTTTVDAKKKRRRQAFKRAPAWSGGGAVETSRFVRSMLKKSPDLKDIVAVSRDAGALTADRSLSLCKNLVRRGDVFRCNARRLRMNASDLEGALKSLAVPLSTDDKFIVDAWIAKAHAAVAAAAADAGGEVEEE